jgi:cytochrome c-type biogenesis protein CcmH/NrfG
MGLAQDANDAWNDISASMGCEMKLERLGTVIQASPHHVDARMMRAECYEQGNDLEMAAGDFMRATKLRPNNIPALLKLSLIRLKLGEPGV